jgi:hypothetical protein
MIAVDSTTDRELKARIDLPDLAEALAADPALKDEVAAYLETWSAKIKGFQDAGVSRGEFDSLTRLSDSIHTAGRVIDFFVKLQKLPRTQSDGNAK